MALIDGTIPEVLKYAEAKTQYGEARGYRFAYRKLVKASGVPLVVLLHSIGTLDDWDPKLIDAIATDRPVIAFDYPGSGRTGGPMPETVEQTAQLAVHFIRALGLTKIDLLGFSFGGFVAQAITAVEPSLVRRIILAGTGQKGAIGLKTLPSFVEQCAAKSQQTNVDIRHYFFFAETDSSQTAAVEYLKRLPLRPTIIEKPASGDVPDPKARSRAVAAWGEPTDPAFSLLTNIKQPVLVAGGVHDRVVASTNFFLLFQQLQNAKLVVYPDSAHGFLWQHGKDFAMQINAFLEGGEYLSGAKTIHA